MCRHRMAGASPPLLSDVVEGNGSDHRRLPRSGGSLGQDATVRVDDHAGTGPGEGWVMTRRGALVTGDHCREVFDGTATIDHRPPVHRLGSSPRIHVSADANQHLGTTEGQFPAGLWKEPVVAGGDTEFSDLRLGDGKEILIVSLDVVGTGVNLPRDPRIDLSIATDDFTLGRDQHGGVEEGIGPARIDLEEGTALDPHAMLAGSVGEAIGVAIGELDRQLLAQLLGTLVDRCRMSELGKDHQFHIMKGAVADHRLFQLLDDTSRVVGHLFSIARVRLIGLAARGIVGHRVPPVTG